MIDKELLRDSELFGTLSEEQLEEVAGFSTLKAFEANEFVFHEQDPAEHLYFVAEGRVAILIDVGLAKKTNVFTVAKGDSFGWSAVVPPYILTASAKAAEASQVVLIDAVRLRELLEKDHELALGVFRKVTGMVSRRVKDTRLQLVNLLHG